ncbi:hypothetical protein FQA39_LY09326 [Lamprigera yunnana]|nr:hypothetical protein FQA39_LY09326 [Lamprigera yunnana]
MFLSLPGGLKMPTVGYGTWEAAAEKLEAGLENALEAGYRHIDTAYLYENEETIGKVVNKWISDGKIKREDLFLVTKLPPKGMSPKGVRKYAEASLKNIQVDYVDLFLLHFPLGMHDIEGNLVSLTPEGEVDFDYTTDHVAIWKEMEKLVDAGLAKAIGISNFNITQIKRILDNARIPPANLQIELHAYFQQKEMVNFCNKHNISVTCYSPLGSPDIGKFFAMFGDSVVVPNILKNPVVRDIATKHNKTSAQVLLRFSLQRGLAVIPKSVTPSRIRENINVFDFTLDECDMENLRCLDKSPAGRVMDLTIFKGAKKHPEYPFPQIRSRL